MTRRYPQAWEQLAQFRAAKEKLGGWPDWCDVPLSGAYAIVSGGRDDVIKDATAVGIVGGLGTWRLTQGVYRFDPAVIDALWDTPIERIPAELLYRLPEWCVYVETPGRMMGQTPLCGAFLWLEWDKGTHRTELRAILDAEQYLYPLAIHLTEPTLDRCIDAALAEALRHMPEKQTLPAGTWDNIRKCMREVWPGLVSLALYLCSDEPDVTDSRGLPMMAKRVARRKPDGSIMPASAPVEWIVGSRIGSVLRSARAQEFQGGEHAAPRPHVRRAHWHSYWTGPRSAEQKLALRWLHPVLVGAGEMPVAIHPVE